MVKMLPDRTFYPSAALAAESPPKDWPTSPCSRRNRTARRAARPTRSVSSM